MSMPEARSESQTEPGRAPLDPRLLDLLRHLLNLPRTLPDHPSIYPFSRFSIDPHDVQQYGSPQRALNHQLELMFGSRSTGQAIEFRGRGSSLEAVVYVLHKYINGEDGENKMLWKWVEELTKTAAGLSQNPKSSNKSRPKPAGKKNHSQPRIKLPAERVNAAKEASAIRYPHNPADLEDDPLNVEAGTGRMRDELLDKLTIPCHSIIEPSHRRIRCKGCGWSWAEPRIAVRILRHASECDGFNAELRTEAKQRGASLSLAAKLQLLKLGDGGTDSPTTSQTRKQKEDVVNHALLKWICDRMIPPSAVDCLRWRELVSAFDPNISTASGTTIAQNFVTTEAAYIHKSSVDILSQNDLLTLSYDGGTTRKRESVYTVHVTTPSTREAYLMEGNEASGVSHTTEHVCGVIEKVLNEVGPERFASIVSDNAGNTRAARALIEQEYPWIITLQDACHQLNNTAKDIGQLAYFQPCIAKLKSLITYFHSSSYAARHLSALRVVYYIAEGLIAIGNTRFASYYYASLAALKCLPLIRELLSSGVLDLKPASPIYWMLDRATVQTFEEELAQLNAALEPFARSIKCLESSHSTLSDVYLFWLAVLARFQELFKVNNTLAGTGLPNHVIENIISILNRRHSELFQGQSGQVYHAAFFIDIRYRSSDILLRRPLRLLAETWSTHSSLPGSNVLPDLDLRQSLPAYTIAGEYLAKLLARIYNKDPNAPLFSRYATWTEIETAFRNQLILFTRGLSPFHRDPRPSAERTYWESLCSVPAAELLAHLGTILTSIVPNSMAEERSMSAITKMNSPDRASQKVSTLIDMVTIRQHYKREEGRSSSSPRSLRPTVRFADIVPVATIINGSTETPAIDPSSVEDTLELLAGDFASEDVNREAYESPTTTQGSSDHFEAEQTDGIFLSSKLLTGLISDQPSNEHKRSDSPEPLKIGTQPPKKRQRIDVDAITY